MAGSTSHETTSRHHGTRHSTSPNPVPQGVPATVSQALRTNGTPLDAGLREKLERQFGADFSAVRIVQDSNADQSAVSINAEAYTWGDKIVFGQGKYSPHTPDGQRLIAHELIHVVQQREGSGVGRPVIQRQEEVDTEVDDIIVWHYINEAMENNNGDIGAALDDIITKRLSDPMDPNLAAADHYLYSQWLVTYTPIPNFGVAYMTLGYGMVKDHLHDYGLGDLLSFSDEPTTPNSVAQTEWGVRGAFEGGWSASLYKWLFED